ncbi:hypothetical protein PTTG_01713 [Puccinia triticina 1-1 BBBD Race 1]|uniref:Uncharacterized protein n=1 Tax=Puccinia triticina (isolate 1-1 / race 1 (BBBD)) TaxID=630390 RepID=A0A0C4ELS6_PUCT1|nr:hypothetical protein PTTG_01713 [Puccinia triticina 1-1 BBBD Race 1]
MNNSMVALIPDIRPGAGGDTPMANTDNMQAAWDHQGLAGLTAAEDELNAQAGKKDNLTQHFDAAEPSTCQKPKSGNRMLHAAHSNTLVKGVPLAWVLLRAACNIQLPAA